MNRFPRSLSGTALASCLAALVLASTHASQGQAPGAGSARAGVPESSVPRAWALVQARLGAGLELRQADERGIEIVGTLPLAEPILDDESAERATQRVLAAAEELLGVPAQELVLVRRSQAAELRVVQLEQRVGGLAVRASRVEARWSPQGVLCSLTARGLTRLPLTASFVLTREDAAQRARLAVAESQALPARALWALAPERELLALADALRPVLRVSVWDPARPWAEWHVTLDAADGRVHELAPAWLDGIAGTVDGRGSASGTLISGPPAVLALGNVQVVALDSALASTRITDNACGDNAVVISADGSRVAWVSDCDGDRELWTAARDGGGALQLTTNSHDDHSPAISADGTRLVFVSDADGDEELWTIQTDGTGLTQLTFNGVRDHAPTLSGDGTRVAYITGSGADSELATLLVAAPTPFLLSSDTSADAAPRIALDGSRIAWLSWSDGDADVCTIAPDGSGFARVTLNSLQDGPPDISSDGTSVVFATRMPPSAPAIDDLSVSQGSVTPLGRPRPAPRTRDLFEASSDGSSLVRLTHSDADERDPSYAIDGGCIAYVTSDGGDLEIELLDLAGGTLVRLTDGGGPDRAPRVAATCGVGAWVAHDGDGEIYTWDLMVPGALASGYADENGAYALAFPDAASPTVSTRLRGRYVRVYDLDPRWGNERAALSVITPTATADMLLNPSGALEGPTAQVTAYHHANRAHDALAAVLARPPLSLSAPLAIDEPLRVNANFPAPEPNAFYHPGQSAATFFVGAGPLRPNTAGETVILHEYGHFFDDVYGGVYGGSACEGPVALSEGIGDTVAMFVTGQELIGQDFYGLGTVVRDYTSMTWLGLEAVGGQQYDCLGCLSSAGKPEPHEHGAAFAGFAWDLRSSLGAILAEDLVFGALSTNPGDMQGAVAAVFALAATPAFGGSGDPTVGPHHAALTAAAARHGFDGVTREDFGTHGCILGVCAAIARHRTIGTEWLGMLVDGETACESLPNPDDDGLVLPSPVMSDETKDVTIVLSVNPAMKASGRYGSAPAAPLPERRVYLNAWLFVDDAEGGFDTHKVLGTGSTSPTSGPDNIPGVSGANTLAFNPDTWGGSSLAFPCKIKIPVVPTPRFTILRVRLDYGEDSGVHSSCLSHPSLNDFGCGIARYGEVEDHQTIIMPL